MAGRTLRPQRPIAGTTAPATATPAQQTVPSTDTSAVKKRLIGDLITHLARSDNHLYQALTSLQQQANATVASLAMVCYGTMATRISTDPNQMTEGSLWFVTDYPNAVYQIRKNAADNKLYWYYATGVVYQEDPASGFRLTEFDKGYTIALGDGYLQVWNGSSYDCKLHGPCLTSNPGGSGQGGGSNQGQGGGNVPGGGGTVGPNPIPPGAVIVGPVSGLAVSGTTVDTATETVSGTFTWNDPTLNTGTYGGVQLWIVGGTTPQAISPVLPPGTNSYTVSISFPSLGVIPLSVAAITVDTVTGLTMDPTTGAGQAADTIQWVTGTGGGDPGSVANFVMNSQVTNSDGSVTALFSWALVLPTIYYAGVRLVLTATTGSESVPQVLASASQPATAPQFAYVTAPASAVGETWTIAAVIFNSVGTGKSLDQSPTRDWTITGG